MKRVETAIVNTCRFQAKTQVKTVNPCILESYDQFRTLHSALFKPLTHQFETGLIIRELTVYLFTYFPPFPVIINHIYCLFRHINANKPFLFHIFVHFLIVNQGVEQAISLEFNL